MIRLLAFWLLLPVAVAAQDMPALYDVAGVAANDTLNVRAAPSAEADVLARFDPDRRGVEVVALGDSGRWGQVNVNEGTGWVSMAFLRPQFPGTDALPRQFACFGAEPFWRLDVEQNGQSSFGEPMVEPRTFATGSLIISAGRTDTYALISDDLTAIIRRAQCSDGMSDRLYGLSIDMVLPGPALYTGCCKLER